ncbi:DUF3152 domain-containing protein [Actinocorallia sp. API 0066]|uniref:DUF3152 domain-containing protein n=1 Tax=Actinocorallia sp. API 0066 TaxID=2896846 RepID=UPI001E3AEBF2|nr:DUF3152 domain-containing protein [Actinocorallia sp. API 0066]MCD0451687.1 DUF3152 domain-containing protein [Actinocorallia sp. API 0066]
MIVDRETRPFVRAPRLPALTALALAATLTAAAVALAPGPTTPPPTAASPAAPSPSSPAPSPTQDSADVPRVVNGRVQPTPLPIPRRASGRYRTAPGTAKARGGTGSLIRYTVEVEDGLPYGPAEFAAAVHTILNDPRGWARFERVPSGPARLQVSLTSPAETRRRCRPLDVGLRLSCFQNGRAVINADRWATGAPSYRADVATYREYLINHEVGHGLGHGHAACPGPGRRAPVMVQQTKSLFGCRPGPWPHPDRDL